MILNKIKIENCSNINTYPYNLEIISNIHEITFDSNITILVGENGTGKSTLIESIALASNSIFINSEDNYRKENLLDFSKNIKLVWSNKINNGFFLNSEDFKHFINNIITMRDEAKNEIARIEVEYKHRSQYAKALACQPHYRTLRELETLYGDGLEFKSHGEGFLTFFKARFRPNSLYLLDEVEVSLSPIKQLALISMINEMVEANCQFIIATHSPILMAIPNAKIYSLDDGFKEVNYEELEHVTITKLFLEDPNRFLRQL